MVEFIVPGTPRSQQAKSKGRWQEKVKEAVPCQPKLLTGPLRLRIDFFFDGATDLDTDNIIKPIQDALNDIVYKDDETVVDVCARKIDLQRLPALVAPPQRLLEALAEQDRDFVFVQIGAPQDQLAFS